MPAGTGTGQRPSKLFIRLRSAFATSTSPWRRLCFLRLPVVGAEAKAAPDLRPARRRINLPLLVTLMFFLALRCGFILGIAAVSPYLIVVRAGVVTPPQRLPRSRFRHRCGGDAAACDVGP